MVVGMWWAGQDPFSRPWVRREQVWDEVPLLFHECVSGAKKRILNCANWL
jgi:hypothetical protein